jgi:cellulose synthase (UDP-forming)
MERLSRPIQTGAASRPVDEATRARHLGRDQYENGVVFAPWRVLLARVVSLTALAGGAFYFHWRLSTVKGAGIFGLVFFVAESINYLGLMLTAVLFWRIRRHEGPPAPPVGTLDVLIPVCGEPVELVEETVRAALSIESPHQTYLLNDGLIAKKANWRDIDDLARRYRIPCLTRTDGVRSKAGNLNHALPHTTGEFVAVIDCDHRARPDFAHQTLGYFSDDKVGFVTTRQQFEGDDKDILGTREPLFFQWGQPAKDTDDAAFSVGNASVYRRSALESAGGFSEWSVIEDLHTSIQIHAKGWTSRYHSVPQTIGIAPYTASALAKQRLTWATDTTRTFFWDNPLFKKGLSLRQRLHYFHTTSYYLQASTQLLFVLSPALWLIWGIPAFNAATVNEYLVHSIPYLGPVFLLVVLYGGRGGMRAVQQQIYLAPVFFLAVLRGATGIRFRSGVTEKAHQSRFSRYNVPQILLFGILMVALVITLVERKPGQWVAASWAGFTALCIASFATAISRKTRVSGILRTLASSTIVLMVLLIAFLTWRQPAASDPWVFPPKWRGALTSLAPPHQGGYLGVFNPQLPVDPGGIRAWNGKHRVRLQIVHWYQQWFSGYPGFRADWMEAVRRAGAVPLITWEPWRPPVEGLRDTDQPEARLELIAAGRYDSYIRAWARGARDYGRPLLLRPMPMMNGDWYPWSIGTNGNTSQHFVEAWRYLHDIFTDEGATNVSWVWGVYSFAALKDEGQSRPAYYPGDDYVDWVAMSGFNIGDAAPWGSWQSFDEIFEETYQALSGVGKPILISEIGTTALGGEPADWIRDSLRAIQERYRLVKAVVWFDAISQDGIDFRLEGRGAPAFRSEASSWYWRSIPQITVASEDAASVNTPVRWAAQPDR